MVTEYPELIQELEARTSSRRLGKASKKVYKVWGVPDLLITRWKFNEWDYYSDKAKLPISARGLFTLENRILVRGYNKFFNIGEVKATDLKALETETVAPYYATVKENGYLALIGAYNGKLVVTSKNSSGPDSTSAAGLNYSETARNWVLKHLESQGKTEAEFAALLEQNDWTAVGEVCDDSFEEHVLPYPPSISGLYLNGLNHNSKIFATESPSKVQEVAKDFGFRQTDFVGFKDFESLMAFLEGGQKTGKWGEREVEGFVIRCRRRIAGPSDAEDNDDSDTAGSAAGNNAAGNNAAGNNAAGKNAAGKNAAGNNAAGTNAAGDAVGDFFWKFKFEEPYLMYREWREVVKSYLFKGATEAYARAKRSRHSESCLRFLPFARSWLGDHPQLKESIANHNLGIIELRNEFFNHHQELSEEALLKLDIGIPRWLLVTVATLGCGKSTVGNALTHLMKGQWAHRQNDALQAKKGKFQRLAKEISEQLVDHDVVILDKNNSGRNEREIIFTEFDNIAAGVGYDMKYVCLNFLPHGPSKHSKELTRERVISRGDNHLTVQVSQLSEKGISGIMSQFENRFDVVVKNKEPDSQFDLIIDLVPGESAENVRRILNELSSKYGERLGIPNFTDAEIADAIQNVRDEEKLLAQNVKVEKPKRTRTKVDYFGVGIDKENFEHLTGVARNILSERDPETLRAINFQNEFHVTMAHFRSHKELYKKMKAEYKSKLNQLGRIPLGKPHDLIVESIYWNPTLLAFKVHVEGCGNLYPHITVGTSGDTPAYLAATLFDGTAQNVSHVDFPEKKVLKAQELFALVSEAT